MLHPASFQIALRDFQIDQLTEAMQKLKRLFKHPNFIPIMIGLHVVLPLLGIVAEGSDGGHASIVLLILFILLLLLIDFTLIVLYVIAKVREMLKGG